MQLLLPETSETELTGCEAGEWGHQAAVVSYKPVIKVRKTQEALQLLAGSGSWPVFHSLHLGGLRSHIFASHI